MALQLFLAMTSLNGRFLDDVDGLVRSVVPVWDSEISSFRCCKYSVNLRHNFSDTNDIGANSLNISTHLFIWIREVALQSAVM